MEKRIRKQKINGTKAAVKIVFEKNMLSNLERTEAT